MDRKEISFLIYGRQDYVLSSTSNTLQSNLKARTSLACVVRATNGKSFDLLKHYSMLSVHIRIAAMRQF